MIDKPGGHGIVTIWNSLSDSARPSEQERIDSTRKLRGDPSEEELLDLAAKAAGSRLALIESLLPTTPFARENFLRALLGKEALAGAAIRQLYVISASAFAMGTTVKTAVEIAAQSAGTGARGPVICQWQMEFANSAAGAGILVELVRVTASTGITGTTAGVKSDDNLSSANELVAKHSSSNEGTVTSTDNLEIMYIPPTGGVFVQYPMDVEPAVAPGTTRYLRLRGTGSSGVTPNSAFGVQWRE